MKVRKISKSIKSKIIGYTTIIIIVLIIISSLIMTFSMTSLTNAILLDTFQPMVKDASKTIESNLHILADRMMSIAYDKRISVRAENYKKNSIETIEEAEEVYEFYAIGLYNKDGSLFLGRGETFENISSDKIYQYLKETDNFSIGESTIFNNKLGITMGMPVKIDGKTEFYLIGIYKYDALNDVLMNINIGKSGKAIIINNDGTIIGHKDENIIKKSENIFDNCSESANDVYNRMINGETGSSQAIIDNENTFIAFSPIRGTHWSLAIQVPNSDYTYLTTKAVTITLIAAIIMLIISIVLIYRLSKSISISVNKATKRIVTLADGDLKTQVEIVNSKDEIELLTSSLQTTISSINYYVSEIRRILINISNGNLNINVDENYKGDFIIIKDSLNHIINSLNKTMQMINNSATRLFQTAEILNGESERLHNASVNQNDSAEMLVNEVDAVEKKLMDVSNNSTNTKLKVSEIADKIKRGNDRMKLLSESMEEISENAHEITNISKIIENIALQTEILSINASIEASKAGSNGTGFSVVANEIKKLSNESSIAAKNSTEMIRNIHSTIKNGNHLMNETAVSLNEIFELSKIIEDITNDLEITIDVQKNSLSNMADNIENISKIADENLRNSESAKNFSNEISNEANELHSMIEKFTLKGDKNYE